MKTGALRCGKDEMAPGAPRSPASGHGPHVVSRWAASRPDTVRPARIDRDDLSPGTPTTSVVLKHAESALGKAPGNGAPGRQIAISDGRRDGLQLRGSRELPMIARFVRGWMVVAWLRTFGPAVVDDVESVKAEAVSRLQAALVSGDAVGDAVRWAFYRNPTFMFAGIPATRHRADESVSDPAADARARRPAWWWRPWIQGLAVPHE
jgi:hypothetical protein